MIKHSHKELDAIYNAVVDPPISDSDPFAEYESPPSFSADSSIPCDVKTVLSYPGKKVRTNFGSFYQTGPFSSPQTGSRFFNDSADCAFYNDTKTEVYLRLETMVLFTEDTCTGFQSKFGTTSLGPQTCDVRGMKTVSAKTAIPPKTVVAWEITGCFKPDVITSMTVNGEKCGTSTAGSGYDAYPQGQASTLCRLAFITGYETSGRGGTLSNLYFFWSCDRTS